MTFLRQMHLSYDCYKIPRRFRRISQKITNNAFDYLDERTKRKKERKKERKMNLENEILINSNILKLTATLSPLSTKNYKSYFTVNITMRGMTL